MHRRGLLPLVACLLVGIPVNAAAQEWVAIKSPSFTVVSNAGEGRARDIAWQFEQIRAAILAGWPWARVQLDRPVMVIAVKDESSMKSLAPEYWEGRDTVRPSSVFVTAADRHYVALRSDVRMEDKTNINPYQPSYWSYSALALDAAFDRPLPLWFRNGLAGVLSNSIVRETEIRFGLPIPWYLETLLQGPRLKLSELMVTDARSTYYTNRATRQRFDAQSWGLMQYLLFGRSEDRTDRVNELVKRLLEGKSSAAAVQEVFGSIDALDEAYLKYFRRPIMQHARLQVETKMASKSFPSRRLSAAESAVTRAGFHSAMDRPAEARALLSEAGKGAASGPGVYEVEAMLLDREAKRDETRAALSKAEELNSENFYVHYRLASLDWRPNPDAATLAGLEKRLRRAVALNDAYAPALAMLADVVADGDQPGNALELAKKAVALEPGEASWRMSLARVLWALSRRDEAKGQARVALTLAGTDLQRKAAQDLIGFFERAQGTER